MVKMSKQRVIEEQTHVYLTNPQTEGNHNPSFLKGPDILLYEDFGSYELGQLWASLIDDHNGNNHQEVHFELTNNNEQLFDIQPHINVCAPGCQCACPNRQPGVNDCGVAPHCGCGQGCGATECGTTTAPMNCPLLGSGTLNFSIAANRFGIATVEVVGIDDGIADEICNGPVVPACTIIPCERIPCTHTSVVEFKITVLPVNDMPDFKHVGDVSSPEDSEYCITRWAYDITAGAWGEEYGQPDGQILTWNLITNNPNLFQTKPYLRYVQGNEWADLCYTPAKDKVGTTTLEVWLSDSGGTQNGGRNQRNPNPEIITITIYEQNDPPSFVAGSLKIIVTEDDPPYNEPWATSIKPGPESEEVGRQQLDRFELTFTDSASLLKFESPPTMDPDTGFLRFTLAPNANTFNDRIEMSVVLWDNPRLIDCQMCTPLRSLAPHPTFTIEITPVNDRPTFLPVEDNLRFINISENQGEFTYQLVRGLCVGGLYPDCILGEADPHSEAQEAVFSLQFDNSGLQRPQTEIERVAFSQIEVNPTGLLTFTPKPSYFGEVRATLHLRDTGGESPLDVSLNTTNITIIIHQQNDKPFYNFTLMPDIVSCKEDAGFVEYPKLILDLRAGPANEEDQLLSFSVNVGNPNLFTANGQPTIIPRYHDNARLHGDLEFTTAPNAFGDTTISFIMYDNGGPYPGNSTDPKEFAIHVEAVNDPPSFSLSSTELQFYEDSGNEGTSQYHVSNFISMSSAGEFEDGTQALKYRVVPATAVSNVFSDGTLPTINQYGSLSFTLPPSWFGTLHFRVTATDIIRSTGVDVVDSVEVGPQDFSVQILPVNDPPTFDVRQLILTIPPCESSDPCRHIIPDFITNASPGIMEQSQELTANAMIVYSERSGSLESNPTLVNTNPGNYSIVVVVKAGAGVVAELHTVSLVFKDSGGVLDDGSDTTVLNITITVSVIGITLPPVIEKSVVITQQPMQANPGSVVDGPIFEIRNPSGVALLMSYKTASITLMNSNSQQGGGSLLNGFPFVSNGPSDLRSVFSWQLISVTAPGEYYLDFNLILQTDEVLSVKTDNFTVTAIQSVVATFPDSVTAAGYPTEKDLQKGLTLVITSGEFPFKNIPNNDDFALITIRPEQTPISLSAVTVSANRRQASLRLAPLPNYNMMGIDKVLSIAVFASSFSSSRDVSIQQTGITGVTVQLSYPILSSSFISIERSSQGTLTMSLSVIGIQPCCSGQSCASSCCSLCFDRSPITGYLTQVQDCLNFTKSGKSSVSQFITSADLTSDGTISVSVNEDGHSQYMKANGIDGEYLEIMNDVPIKLYTVRKTEPIAHSDVDLRRVSFGNTENNVGNDTQATDDTTAKELSFPYYPELVTAFTLVALVGAVLLSIVKGTSFLGLSDIALSHVLLTSSHIPDYANFVSWFIDPFLSSGSAVIIILLFGVIHFALHSFARPHHLYFPSLTMIVCAFFLPFAIESVFRTRVRDSVVHTVVLAVLLAIEIIAAIVLLRKYTIISCSSIAKMKSSHDPEYYYSTKSVDPVPEKQPVCVTSIISGLVNNDKPIIKYWQHVELCRVILISMLASIDVNGVTRGVFMLLVVVIVGVHASVSIYFKPYSHITILVSKICWDVSVGIAAVSLGIPLLSDSDDWDPSGSIFIIFCCISLLFCVATMIFVHFKWTDPYVPIPVKSRQMSSIQSPSRDHLNETTSNPIQTVFKENSTDSGESVIIYCAGCKSELEGNPMFCPTCGHKSYSKELSIE